jgi:hypothetical protein
VLAGLIGVLLLASPEEAQARLKVAYGSLYEWKESGVANVTLDFTYERKWRTLDAEGVGSRGTGQVVVVGDEIVRRHYPGASEEERREIDLHLAWVLDRFVRKPFEERFKEANVWELQKLEDGTEKIRAGLRVFLVKGDRLRGEEQNVGKPPDTITVVREYTIADVGGGYAVAGEKLAYRAGEDRLSETRELVWADQGDVPVPKTSVHAVETARYPEKGEPTGNAVEFRVQFTNVMVNREDPVTVDAKARDLLAAAWARRYVLPGNIRVEGDIDRQLDKELRLADWTGTVKGQFQVWGMDNISVVLDEKVFRGWQQERLRQTRDHVAGHLIWFLGWLHDRPFEKEFAGCGFEFGEPDGDAQTVLVWGYARALAFRVEDGKVAGYLEHKNEGAVWWRFKLQTVRKDQERLDGMTAKIAGESHELRFRYGRPKGVDFPTGFEVLAEARRRGDGTPVYGVCGYELKRLKVTLPKE